MERRMTRVIGAALLINTELTGRTIQLSCTNVSRLDSSGNRQVALLIATTLACSIDVRRREQYIQWRHVVADVRDRTVNCSSIIVELSTLVPAPIYPSAPARVVAIRRMSGCNLYTLNGGNVGKTCTLICKVRKRKPEYSFNWRLLLDSSSIRESPYVIYVKQLRQVSYAIDGPRRKERLEAAGQTAPAP